MEEIGGAFGEIGLLCIIFLVLRPILQAVVDSLRKGGKTLPNWLKKTSQFVTKNHRYAGIVALVAIALHFILQYLNYSVVPVAGLIAFLFCDEKPSLRRTCGVGGDRTAFYSAVLKL